MESHGAKQLHITQMKTFSRMGLDVFEGIGLSLSLFNMQDKEATLQTS